MGLSRALQTLLAAAVLSAAQFVWPAFAESDAVTVVYYGVPLKVDERVSAGGGLLKIALAGEAFLVAASDAPRQVAIRYLTKGEIAVRLSGGQVRSIAGAAVEARDIPVLTAAAAVGVVYEQASEFDAPEVWQQLAIDSDTARAVWTGVLPTLEQASTVRLCLASSAVVRVLRDESVGYDVVRLVADRCVAHATKRALKDVLTGNVSAAPIEILHRDSAPLVAHSEALRESVKAIEGAIAALVQAIEQSNTAIFNAQLRSVHERAIALGVDSNTLPALYAFIDRAIMQHAYRAAIEQIPWVPFEARSSTTHGQVAAALRGVPSSEWRVFMDVRVRSALLQYVAKDEEIRSQWVDTQRRIVSELINGGSLDSARLLAVAVRGEDPKIATEVLATVAEPIVHEYLNRGDLSGAERVVDELMLQPSFLTRVQLRMAHWGVSIAQLGAVGVVIAVLVLSWVRRQQRGEPKRGEPKREHARQGQHCEAAAGNLRRGVDRVNNERVFSADYVAALQLFGLEPGATLAQIKNAYRGAVKQHHPDLKRGSAEEDTTRFIRLTSEYEKLIVLHERESSES